MTVASSLRCAHGRPIYTAEFSPNGRKIATFSADRQFAGVDATSGDELAAFRAHEKTILASFSVLTRKSSRQSEDGTARLWDAEEGRELFAVRHQGAVASAALQPSARLSSRHRKTELPSCGMRRQGQSFANSKHSTAAMRFSALFFSPNGQQVLTVATDKTARLWDMATGAELAVLRHEQWLSSAIFSRRRTEGTHDSFRRSTLSGCGMSGMAARSLRSSIPTTCGTHA